METVAAWPVGERRPVAGSMRKTTMESLSWLAASSHAPVGSMAKLRGHFPCVGSWPIIEKVASLSLTAKTAMLSWPRFDP